MELEIDMDTFLVRLVKEDSKKVFGSSMYKYKPGTIEYRRHVYLKSVYGITLDEYNQLLKSQGYACAICKKKQTEFKKNLSVDHCHKTSKVRGLLCENCNHAIGKFEDNTDILYNAIDYLNRRK